MKTTIVIQTFHEKRRCSTLEQALPEALIEDLADDFLKFFFPNAEEIFDYNRKISFLDKELEQLFPNTHSDRRFG